MPRSTSRKMLVISRSCYYVQEQNFCGAATFRDDISFCEVSPCSSDFVVPAPVGIHDAAAPRITVGRTSIRRRSEKGGPVIEQGVPPLEPAAAGQVQPETTDESQGDETAECGPRGGAIPAGVDYQPICPANASSWCPRPVSGTARPVRHREGAHRCGHHRGTGLRGSQQQDPCPSTPCLWPAR